MIFVDSHVHIHDCFDINYLLESAFNNFQSIADKHSNSNEPLHYKLLLTERKSEKWFKRTLSAISDSSKKQITVSDSWKAVGNTSQSIKMIREGIEKGNIYIVGGIQAVTIEKIEVLGIYTHGDISDGSTLAETIAEIIKAGGIAVLPWGAGKWIGERGRIIRDVLTKNSCKKIYLGDNGGRPSLWPTPKIFIEAGKKGVTVLPGSDPLPLQSEANRIGSYGFSLQDSLSPGEDPTEYLKSKLLTYDVEITPFGCLQSNYRFVLNQFRLRIA